MQQVISLAMPFFGLMLLGFAAGKIVRLPAEGLGWLNVFIVYIALPALFFQLISQTPFEQLARWSYVLTTTFATFCAFVAAFAVGFVATRGDVRMATIQGAAGGYSNVGYMGPGLTLAALGQEAAVPTALIFCFDCALVFFLVPLLMTVGRNEPVGLGTMVLSIMQRVFLHPFILATMAGVVAAYFEFRPTGALDTLLGYLSAAAAPCALFALGVTVALRPVKRIPREMPILIACKLALHPLLVFVLLSVVGTFDPTWVQVAVLMAALPPALNVFVLAQQYEVYVERASSTILFGTVASVFTVTVVLYLVTSDLWDGRLLFSVSPVP